MTDEELRSVEHRLTIVETRFEEFRKALDDRLGKLNELRDEVTSDRDQYARIDVTDARIRDIKTQIDVVDKQSELRHDTLQKELIQKIEANFANLDDKIGPLVSAQSKMIGIGIALIAVASLIGTLAGHFWR